MAAPPPVYIDQQDLLQIIGLKKSRGVLEPLKLYPSIIPSIGYTPQNGVVFGITTLAGIYLGDPRTTTISNIALVALYTSKNQVILFSRNTAILPDNAWQLQGDNRFLATNQSTYGLGSSADVQGTGVSVGGLGNWVGVSGEQPMDFDFFRFHQTVLRRVAGSFYAGASYRLDRHYRIVDHNLNLQSSPQVITSHYAYCEQFGFSPAAYGASGVGAEVLYDSRDSTISAYRGWYASGSFRAYPRALGSSQDATFAQAEVRTYLGLSDEVPRNVIAFWLLGSAVTSGRLPYLALPSIGWDFANRTGRGYVQGRFRGDADGVRRAADALESLGPQVPESPWGPQARNDLAWSVRARWAVEEQRWGDAEAALSRIQGASQGTAFALIRGVRIALLERAEDDAEALRWARAVDLPAWAIEQRFLVPMTLARARLEERLGQRTQALDDYAWVAEMWKDCDPELRPRLEEARRGVERRSGKR